MNSPFVSAKAASGVQYLPVSAGPALANPAADSTPTKPSPTETATLKNCCLYLKSALETIGKGLSVAVAVPLAVGASVATFGVATAALAVGASALAVAGGLMAGYAVASEIVSTISGALDTSKPAGEQSSEVSGTSKPATPADGSLPAIPSPTETATLKNCCLYLKSALETIGKGLSVAVAVPLAVGAAVVTFGVATSAIAVAGGLSAGYAVASEASSAISSLFSASAPTDIVDIPQVDIPQALRTELNSFIDGKSSNIGEVKRAFVNMLIGNDDDAAAKPFRDQFKKACLGSHNSSEMATKLMDVVGREMKDRPLPSTLEDREKLISGMLKNILSVSAIIHGDENRMTPKLSDDQFLLLKLSTTLSSSNGQPAPITEKEKKDLTQTASKLISERMLKNIATKSKEEQESLTLNSEQKKALIKLRQDQTLQRMATKEAYRAPGVEISSFEMPGSGTLNFHGQVEITGSSKAAGEGVRIQFYIPDKSNTDAPIFINVRGTANTGNLIDDFAHEGTTHSFLNNEPGSPDLKTKFEFQLSEAIKKSGGGSRPIIFAGHSLGGAVATGLAIRYDNQQVDGIKINVKEVKAFNGAGVGKSLVDEMKEKRFDQTKVTNFIASGDIIPFGLAQVGTVSRMQTAENELSHYQNGEPTLKQTIMSSSLLLDAHLSQMLVQNPSPNSVTVVFTLPPAENPESPNNVINKSGGIKGALYKAAKLALSLTDRYAHRSAESGLSKTRILDLQKKDFAAIRKDKDLDAALKKLDKLEKEAEKIKEGIDERGEKGLYKDRIQHRDKLYETVADNQVTIKKLKTDISLKHTQRLKALSKLAP